MLDASDIYKFIHQSIFGPAHMLEDKDGALKYLLHEWNNLKEVHYSELFIERMIETPHLIRLNLRPYKQNGGNLEELFSSFVESANSIHGDLIQIEERLETAINKLKNNYALLSIELSEIYELMRNKGFPSIHHSIIYTSKYVPAYRVLNLEYCNRLQIPMLNNLCY